MTLTAKANSGVRPFRGLPETARAALTEAAREVKFNRHERLIPLGQPPERLLILTEGLAKVVGVSPDGHERILFIHRPGDPVGPTVLLDNFEHDYEVVAMGPVRALAISRRDLLRVGRAHPAVLLALAREVSRLLVVMTERIMVATSAEVPIRLGRLLLEFADGDEDGGVEPGLVPLSHPLTHEIMAQIVGASRPHTSTVLRDLEEAGAVRRRSDRGLLVSTGRLRQILEDGVFNRSEGQLFLQAG